MKLTGWTTMNFSRLMSCLTVFVAIVALTACAGQIKDPTIQKYEAGLRERNERLAKEPRLDVLVIKKALKAGDVITKDLIIPAKLPKSTVPAGALSDPKSVIGKKLALDIELGAIITGVYISP